MRRVLWFILVITMLLAAGCLPATVAPATPGPGPSGNVTPAAATPISTPAATAAAAATMAPTAAPATAAATAAATSAPATSAATAVPATAIPVVTVTPAGGGSTGSTGTAGAATFTSTKLGISFDYLASFEGVNVAAQEQGNRVYVYMGNTPPADGQYVQVYQKPAAQSLTDAIQAQVLKGYSLQDCIVITVPNPENGQKWPATYSFARIDVPHNANDDLGTLVTKAQKCPQPYAAVGGLAYFMTDSQHPDRFVFFSIGQYAILAPGNRPWQTTLRFLGPAIGTGGTPEPRANGPYVDDRSSAESVMVSYVNALNHYEYSRAYSYWNVQAGQQNGLPPFDQFRAGFASTKSVLLWLGPITSDAGAGQLYYWTPIAFVAYTNNGLTQTFVGCYKMHLAQPANFGAPPIIPLSIESASVKQVANDANFGGMLGTACQPAGQTMPATPTPAPNDISAARYLDDRSDGAQVLRSLFNAINRREYVRAYSYWEENSQQRPPYDQFAAGYANTKSVDMVVGTVGPGAAAGNIYYQVPVVLIATNTNGTVQTFAGCYTLHMANPGMQTDPPFHPLGIQSAVVKQVANNTDTQPLLQGACNQ